MNQIPFLPEGCCEINENQTHALTFPAFNLNLFWRSEWVKSGQNDLGCTLLKETELRMYKKMKRTL